MAKTHTEKERAFWRNEILEWKTEGGNMSWSRWCQARELREDDMPRPLDATLPPANPITTAYDQKQERRRKRASNALKRAARKEKAKAKAAEKAAA